MALANQSDRIIEPIQILDDALEWAWRSLCAKYDVTTCLPGISELLADADISAPAQASETVLANMLVEIMENVGRFSPWYRMPTRGYGLIVVRDTTANRLRHILTPEAVAQYKTLLLELAQAIQENNAVIQAILIVDGLMSAAPQGDPCIIAACGCTPPRMIRIRQSIFEQAHIRCEACAQPFE